MKVKRRNKLEGIEGKIWKKKKEKGGFSPPFFLILFFFFFSVLSKPFLHWVGRARL